MHVLLTLCIYVFHCMLTLYIMSLIMSERPALHGYFHLQLSVRQCISHLKSRSSVNISSSMFSDSLSLARKEGAFYVQEVQGHKQAVFFPREANGKGNRSECLHEEAGS